MDAEDIKLWHCPLCQQKMPPAQRVEHQCLGLIDANRRGWVGVLRDAIQTGWPMTESVRISCTETLSLVVDLIKWYRDVHRELTIALDEVDTGPGACATCQSEHYAGHPKTERVEAADGGI